MGRSLVYPPGSKAGPGQATLSPGTGTRLRFEALPRPARDPFPLPGEPFLRTERPALEAEPSKPNDATRSEHRTPLLDRKLTSADQQHLRPEGRRFLGVPGG